MPSPSAYHRSAGIAKSMIEAANNVERDPVITSKLRVENEGRQDNEHEQVRDHRGPTGEVAMSPDQMAQSS
jgi:hypothetical protein